MQETRQEMKNKNLDINTLIGIFNQRTGHEVKVENIRTTIFDMFGNDASLKVKTFVHVILTQLQVALSSSCDLIVVFLKIRITGN